MVPLGEGGAEQRVQRRLAAILVADVVGYSRLIEADEEGTRARLRSLQAELIGPRIAADGGRIVKTTGDGILVEFGSAVDAVRNALGLQAAMAEREADLPEDRRITFRVGINVGDVIAEGDDIHGDGVNVAARLEGLCGPGEVYVSGAVQDQVTGKLDASFDDLAEQAVGIDDDLGWSHTALASARLMQRRHEEAIASAHRAVELQPSDADAHAYLGFSLICAGRPREDLAPLDQSLRLDPRYQPRTLAFLAVAYFGLRRFEDAGREMETVVGPLDYGIHFTFAFMAGAYVQVGRTEEAKATVQRLLGYYPGFTVERLRRLFPYRSSADMDFLCNAVLSAGLPED